MKTQTFSDEYVLGIKTIDDQHRRFYTLLGDVTHLCHHAAGREAILVVIDELVDYVHEHFATEERWMKELNYPDYEVHRALHAGFVRRVIELSRDYRDGTSDLEDKALKILSDWFTEYVLQEDPKYVELFRRYGVE